MKFLREMDLYRGLILICLLALPVCGFWCYSIEQSIAECEKAILEATRSGGLLEQIGGLRVKVDLVVQNRLSTNDATQQPRTYFERQILAAATQNLAASDFGLTDPKEEPGYTGTKQRVKDYVAEVTWKRKDLSLPLAFVYAVLFNCESGARPGGAQTGLQSIWKLRKLELVNATNERLLTGLGSNPEAPPPELEDKWSIKRMTFARREPDREK
jgi:hypothetical protein